MRCQDFERLLNERLDARGEIAPGVDRVLDEHASACASCRSVAERYQVLAQAILALGPAPAAPAGFADRFVASQEATLAGASRTLRLPSVAWPVAAAAAVVVIVGVLGFRAGRVPEARPSPRVVEAIDPRKVTDALADATSAAWELALETSAPATRIGRDVLDSAVTPPEDSTPPSPSAEGQPEDPDVLNRVRGRVNDRFRPLSGTARHAFEFLLGPANEPAAPPAPAGGI